MGAGEWMAVLRALAHKVRDEKRKKRKRKKDSGG
jgi:hypothetical protein